MISLPDRLLNEPFVTVFYRSPSIVMLKKRTNRSLLERSSYLARHALSFVVEGEQRLQGHNGEYLTLRAGDLGIIRRGLYTVTDIVAPRGHFTAFLLFFDDTQLSRIVLPASPTTLPPSLPFFSFRSPAYATTFWKSVEELNPLLSQHPTLAATKVQELFAVLIASDTERRLSEEMSTWSTRSVRNLRQFMEQHYDKPLTVEDYASLTGRSESTFRRDFKARFNVSPRQWIIQRRLEKAHSLLDCTDWEVARVAEEVGYDNVSHFISAFKKKYQRTPGQKPTIEKSSNRKTTS